MKKSILMILIVFVLLLFSSCIPKKNPDNNSDGMSDNDLSLIKKITYTEKNYSEGTLNNTFYYSISENVYEVYKVYSDYIGKWSKTIYDDSGIKIEYGGRYGAQGEEFYTYEEYYGNDWEKYKYSKIKFEELKNEIFPDKNYCKKRLDEYFGERKDDFNSYDSKIETFLKEYYNAVRVEKKNDGKYYVTSYDGETINNRVFLSEVFNNTYESIKNGKDYSEATLERNYLKYGEKNILSSIKIDNFYYGSERETVYSDYKVFTESDLNEN